jgi:hypothetical protein
MITSKSVYCKESDCISIASFGIPGKQVSYCSKHRQPCTIRNSNAKCKHTKCSNTAIYGTDFILKHCELHKIQDEINFVEQKCISCGLYMLLDKDKKCEYCNPEIFKTTKLAKQTALMNYLDLINLKGTSTDVIVNEGNCGKERPDRVYELDDKIIILECDEHQHKDRQCICEQTRMVNISQGFGGIPVYFIRWNPDIYYSNNEPESLIKRHKLVGDFINDIINNRIQLPIALLSVIYLYYDNWNSLVNEEWKIITQFS